MTNVWKQAGIPLVVSLVTTHDGEGRANASPASWWTPVSYEPPLLVLSEKPGLDTARNIEKTGLFALHVPPTATMEYAQAVFHTAKPLPYGENELDDVGLKYRWMAHPEMPSVQFVAVDATPFFGCMVRTRLVSGDHVLYEAQVVMSALGRENEPQEIDSVMLHRGMNRFVTIGQPYEVERY